MNKVGMYLDTGLHIHIYDFSHIETNKVIITL